MQDRKQRWKRRLLLALAEAFEISVYAVPGVPQDGRRGGRDLQLHVSGDALGAAASTLAGAARAWVAGGGGDVWTFTHGWRVTPRKAWGTISVLASVETPMAAVAARLRGYAVAITLPTIDGDRAFALNELPGGSYRPRPSRAQTLVDDVGATGNLCDMPPMSR